VPLPLARPRPVTGRRRWWPAAVAVVMAAAPMAVAEASPGTSAPHPALFRTLSYHGYTIQVPTRWKVVDLTSSPHACIRFDRPAVYVGKPGDQSRCPSHLIGGAPGLLMEPLDADSAAAMSTGAAVVVSRSGSVSGTALPAQGPVSVSVRAAGVLVSAVYGTRSATLTSRILHSGNVVSTAGRVPSGDLALGPATAPGPGASEPGTFLGAGFDTCSAPSQTAMSRWLSSGRYAAVGVYIGGVSRGCSQPYLTPGWVAAEVAQGWHLIPTYVGLQAPCTSFYNRMSYDPATAREQGHAEAVDAAAEAAALGMAAPSSIYSDVEGYNNTISSCVAAVLSYVSGWNRGLHEVGYQSGVYSSASSGMHDLSASYRSTSYGRPDDIWMAWWNDAADTDGGSYVPDGQWQAHQRLHQYAGGVWESHGGYEMNIDRDYLDLTTTVALPQGCPTNLDFGSYHVLKSADHGNQVLATQCQLARRGFDPGAASGTLKWRTAAAISAFNASRGLAHRAVVGRRSWTAMLSGGETRVLELGASGPFVRKLQRSLSASLQHSVAITGVFDHPTRRAVVEYQRAHELTVDGTASRQTWAALQAGI
jgi:hypothetical protein